jgi:hypothetical protein
MTASKMVVFAILLSTQSIAAEISPKYSIEFNETLVSANLKQNNSSEQKPFNCTKVCLNQRKRIIDLIHDQANNKSITKDQIRKYKPELAVWFKECELDCNNN